MKLVTMMPFSTEMNLGRAYNEAMELLGEEDWVVFLDHDAIWTTRRWNAQIREAIAAVPDAGIFTAVQSRGWQDWQRAPELDDCFDMRKVRRSGTARLAKRTLLDVTAASGIAGVVMAFSKKTWREVGGFVDGMYCVDHGFHFACARAGKRVYVIEGLLVFHWRRANGDAPPADAPRAKDCPCGEIRAHEVPPSKRIVLP